MKIRIKNGILMLRNFMSPSPISHTRCRVEARNRRNYQL